MSYNISNIFNIQYKLTPAARWANKRIDDFTLIIRADSTSKHFIINENAFNGGKFEVCKGTGKVRHNQELWEDKYTEISLRNGEVCCHLSNYSPKAELQILSADALINTYDKPDSFNYAQFYDRSESFPPNMYQAIKKITPFQKRVIRNLPFASRGYVFHDKKLKALFEKQWWYMPDSTYKASTSDFTARERRDIGK